VPTERFQFPGSEGQQLAAALELPEKKTLAYALFAHCFTCGKDVLAAKRIAVALAAKGIAVLRFDFTGLGSSEGDFANSTFSSNVADLVRAADHLRSAREAPAIVIGHSLGGGTNSGGEGRRHHRGAIRPRTCHPLFRRSHRGHPQARQRRSLAGGPAV
jgi:alpha/beta superfamily hydrolase